MTQPTMNSPCPCGSGNKYKRCCGKVDKKTLHARQIAEKAVAAAMAAYEAQQFSRARAYLEPVLHTYPEDPGLLGILGMSLLGESNIPGAIEVLERALKSNPQDSRLHNFMGQAFLAGKKQIAAERAFGQAVTLDAAFTEAWYNLGLTQLQMHKPDEAIHSLLKAKRLRPNDPELCLHLVHAYYLARSLDDAIKALDEAIRFGASLMSTKTWECAILRNKGETTEAESVEADLFSQHSQDDALYTGLLTISRADSHVGNLESSEYWLRKVIAIRPEDPVAYAELAQVIKFKSTDFPLIEKMTSLFTTCADSNRRGLAFALGKVYSDISEYDTSFLYYQTANNIVREAVPFDINTFTAEVNHLIAFSQPDSFSNLPAGSDSALPIYIVGTPRSGTTLTEQIISSHPEVAGAGEMDLWPRLAPYLLASYTKESAYNVAIGALEVMRQHAPEASRVTDKMPGNFQNLGIIHAVFPNAKIVHTRRHPIDACLSIYFQNFNDGHTYKWDLESLAAWYEQYQRLMAHWRAVLPANVFFEFWYEDLVEDPEGVSRQIMDFLELDLKPEQMDFHRQDRAVFTASKWQARQPIYKSSKERWRHYENHLGPLLRLLKYAR